MQSKATSVHSQPKDLMTATEPLPPSIPKSPYLSDPSLYAFLSPSFSATSYLNSTLPPPPSSTAPKQQQPQTLSTITTQTQTHLTTLSAQTTRLSATLTTLTDEILRRSSRLAYEIELLRDEANALVSALGEGGEVGGDVRMILPATLPSPNDHNNDDIISDQILQSSSQTTTATTSKLLPSLLNPQTMPSQPSQPAQSRNPLLPSTTSTKTPSQQDPTSAQTSIQNLRTLHSIRYALQKTKETFSLALSWPMPPSLLHPSSIPPPLHLSPQKPPSPPSPPAASNPSSNPSSNKVKAPKPTPR